jgi:hypothetical protein
LCAAQEAANSTRCARSAATPSVQRPSLPWSMPVMCPYGLLVTTEAAVARISTGDFRAVPPDPVRAFIALTQPGRDTGDEDAIESLPLRPRAIWTHG